MAVKFFQSQLDYKNLLDKIIQPTSRWLDIGCGCNVIPSWIRGSVEFQHSLIRRSELALGCDPADHRPHHAGLQKYVGDCTVLPYPTGFFNLATANMVAEHVSDPIAFVQEIRRVLAPRGKLVLHTPNLHNPSIFLANLLPEKLVNIIAKHMDGREDEDIFPTYYRMNTRKALTRLPGFRVVSLHCVRSGPLLKKVAVLREAESLLLNRAYHPLFRNLQADWIAVLERLPEEPTRPRSLPQTSEQQPVMTGRSPRSFVHASRFSNFSKALSNPLFTPSPHSQAAHD